MVFIQISASAAIATWRRGWRLSGKVRVRRLLRVASRRRCLETGTGEKLLLLVRELQILTFIAQDVVT